jgi:hypothetical protein
MIFREDVAGNSRFNFFHTQTILVVVFWQDLSSERYAQNYSSSKI